MLTFAILILGGSGIISQIILLRELIITFSGNELSIAIILANWVILEAFGSYLFGRLTERRRPEGTFFILTLFFSVSLPLVLYLARIIKSVISPIPGVGLDLFSIFLTTLVILIPISLIHGGLFATVCKLYSDWKRIKGSAAGRVYYIETGGTIIGGLITSFLLIPIFPSIVIGLLVAIINLVVLFFLFPRHRLLTFVVGFFLPYLFSLNQASIRKRFFDQEVILYKDSYYSNIAVTRMAEQKTYYSNGVPIFTTPYPDITFVEEYVHLPMTFKEDINNLLIISGGVGGIIREFLKYRPEVIDYVELDPLIITVAKRFADSLTRKELEDPVVKIHHIDGRLFLKKTEKTYDLIMIGVSPPSDLQINRLYTIEFFKVVRRRMEEDGILILYLPGSLTYLSKEMKQINRSIIQTLKQVFNYVHVIPGDINIIIASEGIRFSHFSINDLIERFKAKRIKTRLISTGHIRYRFSPLYQDWFWAEIGKTESSLNRDFNPMAMLYTLRYWSAARARIIERWFDVVEGSGKKILLIIGIIISGLIVLNFISKLIKEKTAVITAIGATGFSGMIFQLVVIFGFQILFGYVYYMISLLITGMMGGMALGSILATRRVEKRTDVIQDLFYSDVAIIILSLSMLKFISSISLEIIFIFLALISGLLVGFQFPLGNYILLKERSRVGAVAGSLYAIDLVGGWLGGLFGGILLLPVLGLSYTLFMVCLVKLLTATFLILARR